MTYMSSRALDVQENSNPYSKREKIEVVSKKGVAWENTRIEMDILGWEGKPIHLNDVPAIKDPRTGQVLVHPSEVAKAESRMVAKQFGLEGRDIPLLLMLFVPAGIFKGGEVFYKYHINKMLFYLWHDLGEVGLKEGIEHDEFEPADRGPVPKNISQDLERLSKMGLVKTEFKRWGPRLKDESLKITLTDEGMNVAEKLWLQVPNPLREVALKVKEHIHLKTPTEVKNRVHADFPEYRKVYITIDAD